MLEKFGGYSLIRRIGIGGMAEVFLARHSGLAGFEKDIVIKRIRPHLSEVPAFVNMFLGEAKLAAQLSHPNIVQIYDLGKIKDSYFIAMEYIDGRDLSAVLPRARQLKIPFPSQYALKIASSVCEALDFAHNKADAFGNALHIVHRDVSPENIRIAWSGSVKILDFGIAKAASQLHETQAGQIKGKLAYMSPEQVQGKDLDRRSDVFSLGVVLYEAITGQRPFTGDNEMAIMSAIVEGRYYKPSYFRDDIPEEVEAIVSKALENDRRRRYDSASAMQLDIDRFLAGLEFPPSNQHLAGFLTKQLFKGELEAEQQSRQQTTPTAVRRARGQGGEATVAEGQVSEPEGRARQSSDVVDVPAEAFEITQGVTGRSVLVHLSPDDLERLQRVATRKKTSTDELVRQMVSDALKWSE